MWNAFVLITFFSLSLTAESGFRIIVDTTAAPKAAAQGEQARALCEEWYPKINAALFGPGAPYLRKEVRIVIEPGSPKGNRVAWANDGAMHLYADWLAGEPKDLDSVVVHELSHINQDNYAQHVGKCGGLHAISCYIQIKRGVNRGVGWIAESISDYAAFALYRRNLPELLRIDASGVLHGYDPSIPYLYGMQEAKVPVGAREYRRGYSVGATFLLWLERNKNKDAIRLLNAEMVAGRGRPQMFEKFFGAPLDALWRQFLAASHAAH